MLPVHQGCFVHDTVSGQTTRVAATGDAYGDFLYWTFSGRPPGVGEPDEGDQELPRWRSAAFTAVFQGLAASRVQVAFKARRSGEAVVDGLYLANLGGRRPGITTLVETGTPGTVLDPMAPAGAVVTTFGIERDGLRNGWLAISASMLDEVTGEAWAGVYVRRTR